VGCVQRKQVTGRAMARPDNTFCYTLLNLMENKIDKIDIKLIRFFRKISIPTARWGLFIIFFWFGMLKLIGMSPASGLVESLYQKIITFLPFESFYIGFALLEMLIGILFIIPRLERVVIPLLFVHMVTTFMPLFLLPDTTWQGVMVPTLAGQYIIKNVVIIAAAIGIAAHLHPMHRREG
jgi:uncharacterized membrane protein YkgB